ncbi:MAG: MFS transporter [Chloroflexota bacterium]
MTRTVWLLTATLALTLLPSNVVPTAVPLLRQEWGASDAELGGVFTAYRLGYLAAVLLILPLTDRWRASYVIGGCSAVAALSFLLFPFVAYDPWSAALLRGAAGLGLAGVYLPGVRVVSAASSAERRGLMVSIYVSAYYFGAALSLWASGTLLPSFGWRGASVVLGAVSALALPLALLATWRVSPPPRRSARFNLAVLRNGPTRRTILAYGAHSWELYISRAWLPAFLAAVLVGQGLGDVEAASEGAQWAGLIAGLGTAGVWIGGWLSDRWGRAQVAVTIAAASGCLSLVFGWLGWTGWGLLIAVGCAYGLLLAADSSIYSATVTEVAPEDQLGSAQAAQAFTASFASSVAPVAAGLVLDLGGGYGGAFALAGLVGLAGAYNLLPLARRPVGTPGPAASSATADAPQRLK